MPVKISRDGTTYNLVPAPLVSISKQTFNNVGRPGFGAEYTINFQGTIIPNLGNPVYPGDGLKSNFTNANYWNEFDVSKEELDQPDVSGKRYLNATLSKQETIRWLFSTPIESGKAKPLKVEINGWGEGPVDGSGIAFHGFVDDISFDAESRFANPTSYNVTMRTSSFLYSMHNEHDRIFKSGYFDGFSVSGKWAISNLTESFDIQEDERRTVTWKTTGVGVLAKKTLQSSDRVYAVSRSVTAVGSPIYGDDGEYLSGNAPWKHAQNYVHEYLGIGSGAKSLRENFVSGVQNQALRGLYGASGGTSGYAIADFKYQEGIDPEAGSYSLTENFLLYRASSGGENDPDRYPVIETVIINHNTEENQLNRLSVQGTIQGLNTTSGLSSSGNEYQNALAYWTGYVNSGDLSLHTYQMAKGGSHTGWLHPKHLSKSITNDYSQGIISYTFEFDDRPPNLIDGSVSESIQINDTYPGELFSVTPVIGKSQPVLQYLNSRSEYKRSLSINIVMGHTGVTATDQTKVNVSGLIENHLYKRKYLQDQLLTSKPSISNRDDLASIFWAMNPVNDPNFDVVDGKCFHSAPTESWDARTRNYSYNIEWTYERKNQI